MLIRSPCAFCTARWLPRAAVDPQVEFATVEKVIFEPGATALVKTGEGELGPSLFYPHPDCSLPHPPMRLALEDLSAGPLSPIKALRHFPPISGAPYVCQAIADAPSHLPVRPFISGAGVAPSLRGATHIATIEALERDCALRMPRARTVSGRADIDVVPGFEDMAQDSNRRWVEVVSVKTNENRLLPVEYVQLGSCCSEPDPIALADSTGMAVHHHRASALDAGIREVAERVAIRNLWRNGVSHAWDLRTLPPPEAELVAALRACDCEPILLPMGRVLGHETCLAMGLGCTFRDGELRPLWGAGSAARAEEAANKALNELYGQIVLAKHNERIEAERGPAPERILALISKGSDSLLPYPAQSRVPIAIIGEQPIYMVDRGNILTDSFGLRSLQVIIPSLYPAKDPLPLRDGIPFPFWPTSRIVSSPIPDGLKM